MKKKRWLAKLALWGIFVFLVAVVFYISFQNGIESKAADKQLLAAFSRIADSGNSENQSEIDHLIYILRQSGRVLIFFTIGFFGAAAVFVTFAKCNWFLKTGMAAAILWAIACFTEGMKIYIPTRHYSYEEMMLSVAAVTAGLLAVWVLAFFVRIVKGAVHKRPAADAWAGNSAGNL